MTQRWAAAQPKGTASCPILPSPKPALTKPTPYNEIGGEKLYYSAFYGSRFGEKLGFDANLDGPEG